MKKVILTCLLAMCINAAIYSQQLIHHESPKFQSEGNTNNPFLSQKLGKGGQVVSTWYSIRNLISKSNIGGGLSGFVSFLTHDSLSKFINGEGNIYNPQDISVGHIFDPKDDLISLTDNPESQLSRYNSYKLDSIGFWYIYVRNVDSINDGLGLKRNVVDTLFVAYYNGQKIKRYSLGNTLYFGNMEDGWNLNTRMPKSYIDVDTFLLTSGTHEFFDTTRVLNSNNGFENTWVTKLVTIPAPNGLSVDARKNPNIESLLVGFTITFKSGVPSVVGQDTAVFCYQLDPKTAPANLRRTNYFGYRFMENSSGIPWKNVGFYNTSLFGFTEVAYQKYKGWEGYVAGQFIDKERFLDAFFYITVDTTEGRPGVGMEENKLVTNLQIYPNPCNDKVTLEIELLNSSDIHVSITNVIGEEVYLFSYPKTPKGKFELPISVQSLNAGVYFLNIHHDKGVISKKLVVSL